MFQPEYEEWLRSPHGFFATDPWNMRDLCELILDGQRLLDDYRFELCVVKLQALGKKAIVTWSGKPEWRDTFFEVGINTTYFDDIQQQIFCSGVGYCNYFWIGSKLPTKRQIRDLNARYPL